MPRKSAVKITDAQLDSLLASGFDDETLLVGLQPKDLPKPPFSRAISRMLLRLFAIQAGEPACERETGAETGSCVRLGNVFRTSLQAVWLLWLPSA